MTSSARWRPVIAFVTVAFVLHWSWETFHSVAYVNTNVPLPQRFWHCLPMAIVDTAWSGAIVLLGLAAATTQRVRSAVWILPVVAGAISATAVERFAITTGRWTYNELMPIVPLVNVGLWPVVQMSVLPGLSLYVASRFAGRRSISAGALAALRRP